MTRPLQSRPQLVMMRGSCFRAPARTAGGGAAGLLPGTFYRWHRAPGNALLKGGLLSGIFRHQAAQARCAQPGARLPEKALGVPMQSGEKVLQTGGGTAPGAPASPGPALLCTGPLGAPRSRTQWEKRPQRRTVGSAEGLCQA